MTPLKAQIIEIVNQIPKGKVVSYAQVSNQITVQPVRAQVVGWILSGMKPDEWSLCPWHRVVNQQGYITSLKLGGRGMLQIQLLADEGVEIINDFVDMKKYRWEFEI